MKLENVILRDTRTNQPAATTVPIGTIYYVTDENVTERGNGTTWDDVSDAGSSVGAAILLGQSGGQILNGGTGANEDLTLRPTTNSTKGDVFIADTGGNVIIGGGATASKLRLLEASGSGTNYTEFVVQPQTGNITYTLPTTDGNASEFLQTDGSGSLTWAAASGGGGSGAPYIVFRPMMNEPPASAYATLDLRNVHPTLDFDGATDEEAVFSNQLQDSYGGGGLTLSTFWSFTSATSGSLRVQAAIERMDLSSLDIDADSFAAFQSAGGTAPGTSGQIIKVDVVFTDGAQMDSLAAGELFRVKIRRDADGTSGTDDITTDAELLMAVLKET